jgi:hypothetical protein
MRMRGVTVKKAVTVNLFRSVFEIESQLYCKRDIFGDGEIMGYRPTAC